jgi:hypothetical protein
MRHAFLYTVGNELIICELRGYVDENSNGISQDANHLANLSEVFRRIGSGCPKLQLQNRNVPLHSVSMPVAIKWLMNDDVRPDT